MSSKAGYGYNVSGLMRDYIVSRLHVPYAQAAAIADDFDKQIANGDWLELYDGSHFEKTWIPADMSTSSESVTECENYYARDAAGYAGGAYSN
ncbi:MAG: hypothetical protein WC742_15400 [Gallionellaceae bacterium]|jgi:hypothetical protein